MRVPRTIICLLLVALACLHAPRPLVASSGPGIMLDAPLLPLTAPLVAELVAYTCTATVACADDACTVHTAQTYHLDPAAGIGAATLRVGWPVQAADGAIAPTALALLDERGEPLPIAGHDADHLAIWEIPIERGGRRTLTLSYDYPATASPFIIWSWQVSALSAWGTVPAVHGAFVLPIPAHDDALVRVDPHRANLLGERLWWDYAMVEHYPPHHVVAIAPPVWERLQAQRAEGAHEAVAATLSALQDAARAASIPGVDYTGEIIAELLAALEADAGHTAARVALATTYRTLADEDPQRRLGYLLLAARELATIVEAAGGDTAAVEDQTAALGRIYLAAAETASAAGDAAGALEYLGLARAVAGAHFAEELTHAEELTLRWALDLAEQGRVDEALAQLDGQLAPALYSNLVHFAPPLVAARTEVSLRPSTRTVRYHLEPYPLTAQRLRDQLADAVQRLQGVPCCAVTLEDDGATLLLALRTPAGAPQAETCRDAVRAALHSEQDLVGAILAQPWQEGSLEYRRAAGLLHERHRYSEQVDTTAPDAVWRSEAEYAGWRLVELHNAQPSDTRAHLEHQLALAIMREQRHTWDHLPSASQWVYDVAFADVGAPSASWLVAWGQQRTLVVDRTAPHWDDIRVIALVAAALLALALLARRLWQRQKFTGALPTTS
ncbi:MAG TPA: hypothetical protein GX714_05700 [Chloroflexi bacterium]|jgi:hypothetical protein|nr:hypothetical protein [Chloroflexota bacterium]